ncbi:hypothetical protein V499_05931 [Pseudogymnoascus sp. VKM F-103]|nr:hypothetical protein V499_05931 [Pseudogymnoascus sp. VKM F-103]
MPLRSATTTPFKTVLKTTWTDLDVAEKAIHKYDDDNYEFIEAVDTAPKNLQKSEKEVKASGALSEAGVADIKLIFQDLVTVSKALHDELIVKRPTIEATRKCRFIRVKLSLLWAFSANLVNAIADNSEPKIKDLIRGYAGDYLVNIRKAEYEFDESKCIDATYDLSSQGDL